MRSRRQNSGRPLKILFIGADLSTGGGVNKVVRDLAVLFTNEMRAKVTVVAARGAAAPTYDFPPDIVVERHQRRSLSAYFALLVRLRRRQFDVVISSWAQENILTALAFAGSGAKVVLVEHAPWHFHGRVIRAVRRLAYPLATSVVALNRRDYDYHRRLVRDVRLIPNPVLVPAAVTASARQKLVLAIGHLEPLKQFDHALSAMKGSGLEKDGWSLALIGSGSCESELRALIDRLGLKNATIHNGPQNLDPWYAKASILLVTSRLESFSLVLAEAMGHGVVPIAYASDGPSMILEDFPEQLAPIGDVGALGEKLRRTANDEELDDLRGQLAASVRRRFSPDIVMRSWRKLLGADREE